MDPKQSHIVENTLWGKLTCTSTPNDELFLMFCCIQSIQVSYSITVTREKLPSDFHATTSPRCHLELEIFDLSLSWNPCFSVQTQHYTTAVVPILFQLLIKLQEVIDIAINLSNTFDKPQKWSAGMELNLK